ncbi:enoyl-CoA hydratase/isomerase family protein [Pseudomonas sp. GX19020]|jgi:enoyl-CoA hydratase|uniref:enoyl-CoA hydratase/isomerase family protein n=1 Tax=Pseudomonas sp. GX19020 TaxID=2942277 RepID=UPI00201902BB|nr:enoyl-CoA hydratase/isomerase family protein [Pseudomonas sp. GX19020]MCL4068888.1 enoyl-CoA hydratase/isomerase family protein [Pseudomonas sp. GX19020]
MASDYETIRVEVSDEGIAHIILNRPRVLNAINSVMMREVNEVMDALERAPDIRCFIVSGEGRAFSAGFDLKESAAAGERSVQDWRRVLEADFDFVIRFWDCPKPTISAIHGHCIGGGLELAVACDIAIAGEDAIFGEPEVRFGSGIVAMVLPWMVAPKHAKDILLTGNDQITATRAAEIGLVTETVWEGHHVERAFEKALEIAAAAPLSVELTKRAINRSFDMRGMRNALLAAVETDLVIETSGGAERAEFNRIRKEEGLKAAIAWRNSR